MNGLDTVIKKKEWEELFASDRKEAFRALKGAVQFYMTVPDLFIPERFRDSEKFVKVKEEYAKIQEFRAKIQEFGTAADFPTSILPTWERFHALPMYDNNYELIFDIRNFAGERRDGFNLIDVQDALSFRRIQKGDSIDVFQMSGTKTRVYFDYYGGALSIHRGDLDNGEYWTIEDNMRAFRNEAYRSRAANHYALLEAVFVPGAGGKALVPAWQAHPDGAAAGARGYTAGRDIETMNLAARTIIGNVQNSGYGVTPDNATFIVLTPLALKERIKRAINYTYDNFAGSTKAAGFNFVQVTSTMLAYNNRYYVILPKFKIKSGYKMDLTMFDRFDELTYAFTQAGWMCYGAAVGDQNQLEACPIA